MAQQLRESSVKLDDLLREWAAAAGLYLYSSEDHCDDGGLERRHSQASFASVSWLMCSLVAWSVVSGSCSVQ